MPTAMHIAGTFTLAARQVIWLFMVLTGRQYVADTNTAALTIHICEVLQIQINEAAVSPAVGAVDVLLQPAHEALPTEDMAAGDEGVGRYKHLAADHTLKLLLQFSESAP